MNSQPLLEALERLSQLLQANTHAVRGFLAQPAPAPREGVPEQVRDTILEQLRQQLEQAEDVIGRLQALRAQLSVPAAPVIELYPADQERR